jgi:hypothetical protein
MTSAGGSFPEPDAAAVRSSVVAQGRRIRTTAQRQREDARRQRLIALQMSAWAGELLAGARPHHGPPEHEPPDSGGAPGPGRR